MKAVPKTPTACELAIAYVQPALREEDAAAIDWAADDAPVFKALCPGLIVSYLTDDGDDYRYLQRGDVRRASLSDARVHRMALENLARFATDKILIQSQGKVFALLMGGNFEASAMLLDGLWDQGIRYVAANDFVAAIPARDVLAFCDSGSAEGLAELREIVDRVWKVGDHLLTRTLYRRRGSAWEAMPDAPDNARPEPPTPADAVDSQRGAQPVGGA